MKAFWTGLLGAATTVFMLGFALAAVGVKQKVKDVRRGWDLRPVVVAAVDIDAGTELTFDMISQRTLPEQYVTESEVTPEQASEVVGHAVTAPLQAGDPVTWGDFAETASEAQQVACLKAIHPAVLEASELTRSEAVKKFNAGGHGTAEVPQPPLELDGEGRVKVVAVSANLDEGTTLDRTQLELRAWPKEMMTDSLVPAAALEQLVGARLTAPVEAGDVLQWQLMDPGSELACQLAARAPLDDACAKAADAEAKKFFAGEAK